MKKRFRQCLFLFLIVAAIAGCRRVEKGTEVRIQVGEQEFTLSQLQTISTLREEILEHVKADWDLRGETETDWIRVYSLFTGEQNAAEEFLKAKNDRPPLGLTSERSTPKFRLRQEIAALFVVETMNDDGSSKSAGSSNSGHWTALQAILNSVLNDAILQSILNNDS